MTYPKVTATVQASAVYTSPASSGTTPGLAVSAGDSVYVFVGYSAGNTGGVSVSSVTDSQSPASNVYKRAGKIQNTGHAFAPNPAVEIWYADNVPANSSLKVTVTFSGVTVFVFAAADVVGVLPSGSLDSITIGQKATSTSSSDPLRTVSPYDLVIACQCSYQGAGTFASAGGFVSLFVDQSGSTGNEDLSINGWSIQAVPPADYNSQFSWPT